MRAMQETSVQCGRSDSGNSDTSQHSGSKGKLTKRRKEKFSYFALFIIIIHSFLPVDGSTESITSSVSSTRELRSASHIACQLSKDYPGYFEYLQPCSVFRKPVRKSLSLPNGFKDSYKLQHPDLSEGDREYLRHKAAVYSMSDMKEGAEWRFRQALQHQIKTVFHPLVRNVPQSKEAVKQVATRIKAFPRGEIDKLSDEWLEYMSEKIPEDWYCRTAENTDDDEGAATDDEDTAQSRDQVVKYERIDVYWSKVGKMTRPTRERKYSALMKLARIALTLNHGNVDVERGFSKNKLLLTSHRTRLEMPAINGLHTVSSFVSSFGSGVTQSLYQLCFHTYAECKKYFDYLEKPRKRQFGTDPRVWRNPPKIPPKPLFFHRRSSTVPAGFERSQSARDFRTAPDHRLPRRTSSASSIPACWKETALYYDPGTRRTLSRRK
ncbi:hypothetical protein HOLleu_11202 [Holothuria leucospilota]|uniref:HAT C-terminal dimerisation domain-containing protein n=1 Tax=Holothuria leucospilota TaxID=206669 RepID=A0A9Q1CEY4_HOLLE|nr:hypothetical protein HOLleu_11202 [Holothuria leucospilota]